MGVLVGDIPADGPAGCAPVQPEMATDTIRTATGAAPYRRRRTALKYIELAPCCSARSGLTATQSSTRLFVLVGPLHMSLRRPNGLHPITRATRGYVGCRVWAACMVRSAPAGSPPKRAGAGEVLVQAGAQRSGPKGSGADRRGAERTEGERSGAPPEGFSLDGVPAAARVPSVPAGASPCGMDRTAHDGTRGAGVPRWAAMRSVSILNTQPTYITA